MVKYPSRAYVTPRTRYLRRIYFAAAAAAIILIAIITLLSLSEQPMKPQVSQEASSPPEQDQQQLPPPVPEQSDEQPARFSMPLDLNDQAMTQDILAEPDETELPDEEVVETAAAPELQPAAPVNTPAEARSLLARSEPPPQPVSPVISADAQAQLVIDEALRLLNARPIEVIKAREMLNELLGKPISEQTKKVVKQELSKLADKWLFGKTVYPQDTLCTMYRVQSGDLLSTIGKKHNVPWQILQQINAIPRPEALQADQSIKVINGPFHAKVTRSDFTLDLYLQDTFVRSFPVGLGKTGYETPTGLWIVRPGGKLIKPRWTDPDTGKTYEADDPNYPLGSRWISLDGLEGQAKGRTGFAIHGTKDPHEIGVAKSRGCIRLYNGDVILVYDLLMPGQSKVVVTD